MLDEKTVFDLIDKELQEWEEVLDDGYIDVETVMESLENLKTALAKKSIPNELKIISYFKLDDKQFGIVTL